MATMLHEVKCRLVVPADYLEDVRTAIVREIEDTSDSLKVDQTAVLSGSGAAEADRAHAAGWIRKELDVLEQLLDATCETELVGEGGVLIHVLEEMVRVLTERLAHECVYSPIGMGGARDLAARLRWAAEEAIRIEPALDEGLEAR